MHTLLDRERRRPGTARALAAAVVVGMTALMAACAAGPGLVSVPGLPDEAVRSLQAQSASNAAPAALLLGEQHDAAEHQRLHALTVAALAAAGRLAGLAIEMAEAGVDTRALGPQADEAAVRGALRWNEQAWPWAPYSPAIMAAVRAGVPVFGANLPRDRMRDVMRDESLDRALPPEALARQRDAVRDGHCGLMPEAQLGPMARIQVARDRAMAGVLARAHAQASPNDARGARTVVLLAGHAHVDGELGVPRHLPEGLRWAAVTWPAQPPQKDYCEALRQQMHAPRR